MSAFHLQNQTVFVSLVLQSSRTCVAHVSLVSHSCCSCHSCVALVSHLCYSSCTCAAHVAPVWHSCCKIDYIVWNPSSTFLNKYWSHNYFYTKDLTLLPHFKTNLRPPSEKFLETSTFYNISTGADNGWGMQYFK